MVSVFRHAGTHAHPVLFDQTAQAGCLSKLRETSIDSTGVVTSRWPFTLISIRKPSYIPRNLQIEPPSVAPCRFAGVNSGKNGPPRTRISPFRPSMIVILETIAGSDFELFHVLQALHLQAIRPRVLGPIIENGLGPDEILLGHESFHRAGEARLNELSAVRRGFPRSGHEQDGREYDQNSNGVSTGVC